ncbi:MAG: hypothetical protein WDO13_04645 [Verrucomicrobiota bacterium]
MQVHPQPGEGAEPKTEMWYFLECAQDAKIYAGLRKGVTRAQFEKAIGTPELASLLGVPQTPAERGQCSCPAAASTPSAPATSSSKCSRTPTPTYRVDDWGRVDDQGRPARAAPRAGHGLHPLRRL